MYRSSPAAFATAALVALVAIGCATRGQVRREIETVNERIVEVEGQVETNQTRIDEQQQEIEEVEASVEELSVTARDALERALEAGKLAEGKLLFETVLSDDQVRFEVDRATLLPDAMQALDGFATRLTGGNESVFIEIQGHTDADGDERHNLALGERRAEAVRRYLNLGHGIPLHRMSVISYGESEPIADNTTAEGRARNRRVVLVVLR